MQLGPSLKPPRLWELLRSTCYEWYLMREEMNNSFSRTWCFHWNIEFRWSYDLEGYFCTQVPIEPPRTLCWPEKPGQMVSKVWTRGTAVNAWSKMSWSHRDIQIKWSQVMSSKLALGTYWSQVGHKLLAKLRTSIEYEDLASVKRCWGFPGDSVHRESDCQCRRCRFDSWARKIPWRRNWQPTPVFSWEIPWTEEPGRLQPMGSQRVGHDTVGWYKVSPSVMGLDSTLVFTNDPWKAPRKCHSNFAGCVSSTISYSHFRPLIFYSFI